MAKPNSPIKEGFKELLRKSGYKATPARIGILSLMKASKRPVCAQDIIEKIGSSYDQATIYRTLKNILASGIIRQVDLRHNHAHYELIDSTDHHHLICTRCGRIEEIAGCETKPIYQTILNSSKYFREIREHALEYYGICISCSKNIPSGRIK